MKLIDETSTTESDDEVKHRELFIKEIVAQELHNQDGEDLEMKSAEELEKEKQEAM